MEKTIKRRGTSNAVDKLTPQETLLIWRKRMKWTQAQAAKHFKISLFELKLAEYRTSKSFAYPKDFNLHLALHEKCLIARKRAKKKQRTVAKALNISTEWLRQMETGKIPCVKLAQYWGF